jgi:hypothetical protein
MDMMQDDATDDEVVVVGYGGQVITAGSAHGGAMPRRRHVGEPHLLPAVLESSDRLAVPDRRWAPAAACSNSGTATL